MAEQRRGTKKVLGKLENSVKEGNHYEAQQMIKTLYYRLEAYLTHLNIDISDKIKLQNVRTY